MANVKTTKYVRVVGYYGKTSDMNDGKTKETNSRKYMVA